MAQDKNRIKPTISVIVPVYNVEAYLRQCIDSILAQTFTDFELILVNDGSSDNCGPICDEYAEKDTRITVIHQENGGVSAARNAGLDWVFANSNSQWITFVDSDDALSPIMLESLYKEVIGCQADIATTFAAHFSDDSQLEQEGKFIGKTTCFTGRDLLESFYRDEGNVSVVIWGKLYRHTLFQDIRFPVGKIHEDEATFPILLFHADKVAVIHSWLYYYRQREGSIMNTPFSAKRFDHIEALAFCADYFERHGGGSIAKKARDHYLHMWARTTITARQKGIYSQVPAQYRMNILKAFCIILVFSLRSGGLAFVVKRIRNLINQAKQ